MNLSAIILQFQLNTNSQLIAKSLNLLLKAFLLRNKKKTHIASSSTFIFLICLSILPLWVSAQTDSVAFFSNQNQIEYLGTISHVDDWKSLKNEIKNKKHFKESSCIGHKNQYWKFYTPEGELVTQNIDYFVVDKSLGIRISSNYNWGLISADGKLIAEPNFTEFKLQNGFVLGKSQNQISIKTSDNQLVKKLQLASLRFLSKDYGVYGIEKKYGVINLKDFQYITKPIYDEITLFNDTNFLVKKGDKMGLLNFKNELLIPIEYSSIRKDTLNFIKLQREREINGVVSTTVGICNYQGRILIPLIYRQIGKFTNGLFPALDNKYWGYLTTEGEKSIAFFYDTYSPFVAGLAAIYKNGMVGIIDTRSNWIAYPEYDKVQYVNDSVWIWRKNGVSGFYSIPEKKEFKPIFEFLEILSPNFIRFTENNKCGLVSSQRQSILKAEWDIIEVFEDEKIIIAAKNNYYSIFYLNGNLKVFMNYPFSQFDPYKDGMAMVVQKGKYGFIDKDGLLLVSTQYDEARPFKNGLAAIKIGNNWGFIDKNEHFVANPFYDEVKDFDAKAAIVIKNNKYGLINRNGKETSKPVLDYIEPLVSGHYLLKKEGRYGIADSEGLEKINPIYKDIVELKPGIFRARLYGKYSLIDLNHKLLTTSDFDNIEYGVENGQFIFTTKFEWKALK